MNRNSKLTEMEMSFEAPKGYKSQHGGGLLGVVAALGIAMVLVQGTMYYRASGSAKLVGSEKNKILAQQMAEAGVEANIADLGSRKVRVHAGIDTATYDRKTLGDGDYSSRLTLVAAGDSADTVDLRTTGHIGSGLASISQTVQTRLRVKKKIVSGSTSTMTIKIDTSKTQDPLSFPPLLTTQDYLDCKNGALPNCFVCHVPKDGAGVLLPKQRQLLWQPRIMIAAHGPHPGDYVTVAGDVTCGRYAWYDTTYSVASTVDTTILVKVLAWK
jgi:hypothetical protein